MSIEFLKKYLSEYMGAFIILFGFFSIVTAHFVGYIYHLPDNIVFLIGGEVALGLTAEFLFYVSICLIYSSLFAFLVRLCFSGMYASCVQALFYISVMKRQKTKVSRCVKFLIKVKWFLRKINLKVSFIKNIAFVYFYLTVYQSLEIQFSFGYWVNVLFGVVISIFVVVMFSLLHVGGQLNKLIKYVDRPGMFLERNKDILSTVLILVTFLSFFSGKDRFEKMVQGDPVLIKSESYNGPIVPLYKGDGFILGAEKMESTDFSESKMHIIYDFNIVSTI